MEKQHSQDDLLRASAYETAYFPFHYQITEEAQEEEPKRRDLELEEHMHIYAYEDDTSTHAYHVQFLAHFGMLSNSYYAKPLLFATMFMFLLNGAIMCILFFVIPQVERDAREDGALVGVSPYSGGKCEQYLLRIVYFAAFGFCNILLALPAISMDMFPLHQRDAPTKPSRMHKFCLVFVVFECLVLIGSIAFWISVSVDVGSQCLEEPKTGWRGWFYTLFAGEIVSYIGLWYQIFIFDRFRSHYTGQLGLGTYRTKFLNARARNPWFYRVIQMISKRIAHKFSMRDKLYLAAFTSNLTGLRTTLDECRRIYGSGFAVEFYRPGRLWFSLIAFSKHNPLHFACAQGNVKMVNMLLDAGFEINSLDKLVPFLWTIENVYQFVVDGIFSLTMINKSEAQTNVYGDIGRFSQTLLSPLHCAVANDKLEVVNVLIRRGANLNIYARSTSNHVNVPPIFMVQSTDVADALIRAGANHLAVPASFVRTVYGVSFQQNKLALCRSLEYWGGDFALTPLHNAAANDDVKKVVSLLDWGAIPDSLGENVRGFYARSPLHWSAISNAALSGKELIERGATINLQDTNSMTPLHWACFYHHNDMAAMLLSCGADPNLRDRYDRTALGCAAEREGADAFLFRSLVSKGADINTKCGKYLDTPLHIALKLGHKDTAIGLLRSGADILITNSEGKRPLDCTLSTEIQYAVKKEAGTRDVMISYTHSHTEFATKVRKSLETNNITVWMDTMSPSGIGGGAVWREEVARGISNASVVLCLVTEDFQESSWCMKELALAKQVGTPIVALSCENVQFSDELQVYLYTRQIIPFEGAITSINKENRKNITYSYDAKVFESQLGLLLDGLRDEIEKKRIVNVGKSKRKLTLGSAQPSLGSNPNPYDQPVVFISHGGCHSAFAKKLADTIRAIGFECYASEDRGDMQKQIRIAKDTIMNCLAFIPILSDISTKNDVLSDQLAYAEDKGRLIIPVLYTEPQFDLAKKYQLSRNKFFHFSGEVGYKDSFDLLEEHLVNRLVQDEETIPILESNTISPRVTPSEVADSLSELTNSAEPRRRKKSTTSGVLNSMVLHTDQVDPSQSATADIPVRTRGRGMSTQVLMDRLSEMGRRGNNVSATASNIDYTDLT